MTVIEEQACVQVDLETLRARYHSVRSVSCFLVETLSAEDQMVQSLADVSPTKWHQAHTTRFFETLILRPFLKWLPQLCGDCWEWTAARIRAIQGIAPIECLGRIQRHVYVLADDPPGRIVREFEGSYPPDLSQLLLPCRTLAIQWNTAGEVTNTTWQPHSHSKERSTTCATNYSKKCGWDFAYALTHFNPGCFMTMPVLASSNESPPCRNTIPVVRNDNY